MSKAPLALPALALAAGIVAAHLLPSWAPHHWLWAMAACGAAIGLLLTLRRTLDGVRQTAAAAMAVLFCGLLGALLCSLSEQRHWSRSCPEHAYLEVRLCETPQPQRRSYKSAATVAGHSGKITVYLRADSAAAALRYGDRLLLHGWPDTEKRRIYITSDHYLVTERDSTSLRARCEALRMRLLRRMEAGPLSERHTGIAAALTLGWRAGLEPETKEAFRDAGIAHLLSVSGLHVGLLAVLVGCVLFWVGRERRGRRVRGCIQLAAVWAFALMTGMAPPTMRAALMFSLFIAADSMGRRTPKLNLLAAAAIVTLVADPLLLFDTGWQLSYSAVAGILAARPVIGAYRSRLWHAAIVSVAATVATLPVTLTTFHRVQPYFLIANVVIIPLASFILLFALFYLALPCGLTAWPLGLVLGATEGLTGWVASLPGAVLAR